MTRRSGVPIVGWDIGGVNTKAARVNPCVGDSPEFRAVAAPYELQRDPGALVPTLVRLAQELGCPTGSPHAVTMTAELSQLFRTKRDGVAFVLDSLETAFPGQPFHVYTVDGHFISPAEARTRPLEVGASNWAATARLVGRFVPDAILIDIGTTSTDIIPIVAGRVEALGQTDPARLSSGELVYTGALRTPTEALAGEVPLWGGRSAVSAEGFALIGDVHLWLGRLAPADYSVPTPDGRPATREFAGERLARVVCGDRELLDEAAIDQIAGTLAEAQVRLVGAALERVRKRWPKVNTAVVTGLGDFIAADAAVRVGLRVVPLADRLGAAARTAPAVAVAWLLSDELASLPA
jgi:(4-(4-[2-(gamma-L-glutamylamino)ethyl]phenoxymethyl)furan-2-yl)methanamine synthase